MPLQGFLQSVIRTIFWTSREFFAMEKSVLDLEIPAGGTWQDNDIYLKRTLLLSYFKLRMLHHDSGQSKNDTGDADMMLI